MLTFFKWEYTFIAFKCNTSFECYGRCCGGSGCSCCSTGGCGWNWKKIGNHLKSKLWLSLRNLSSFLLHLCFGQATGRERERGQSKAKESQKKPGYAPWPNYGKKAIIKFGIKMLVLNFHPNLLQPKPRYSTRDFNRNLPILHLLLSHFPHWS